MNELKLFTEALNRSDPAERAAFLDQACAGNPELRRRVEELLAGHAESRSPLDPTPLALVESSGAVDLSTALDTGEHRPDKGTETLGRVSPNATTDVKSGAPTPPTGEFRLDRAAATIDHPDAHATTVAAKAPAPRATRVSTGEGIGTTIAERYLLVEVIGEGGMGSVYLANQSEPVKRQVALKLIKKGMDSRSVLARFDAERQALALMDHPNIARIYDGGLTLIGQPFFVMELVRGVPLTEYCDQKRLSVKDRLELFVSVCQAVQHAHQKGIIHRDLKPGNVLVTEVDGRATPKIIDFGVAKATEQNLTDMSFADTGAIVGTPTYMSPEQTDPSLIDIDTRTDVYALGVMLYELLVGSPPLDAKDFKRGAILEMLRMVREVDPPRPSTKLSTAEALPNIAANRSIEPARLAKLLQGELDWVVMKAMEKDRNRRYETANAFARDIQRYLADEVVEARPPSRGYRIRKFVKRNKIQVIAASLVFLALVGGIVAASLGMASARRARDAESVQRGIAIDQRDRAIVSEIKARKEATKTRTIVEFLTNDLLAQAEPVNNAVEDKVTLLEVLDRAAKKVETRFADQPELEQFLRATIARTYHSLASWEKAETQRRALLNTARQRDPHSAEAYLAQGDLAHILGHRGRRDAEVLKMAEEAAEGLEHTLGPDHLDTLSTLYNLGLAYRYAGKLSEAIALFERVRDAEITGLGPNHPNTLNTLHSLAGAYQDVGRLPEAITLLERVRDAQITGLGLDHPDTLGTLHSLALAYRATGKLPEAIALLERVRDANIAQLGPDHSNTLTTLHNLALAYKAIGRLPEAIALFERVRDAQVLSLGPDHSDTLNTLHSLAGAFKATGRLPEAVALFERVRDAQITGLGPDHPDTLGTLHSLAAAYQDANRLPEAIALLERVRDARSASLGPNHPDTLNALNDLGAAYWRTKQLNKSVPLFEDLLKRREVKLSRRHLDTQTTVANLGVNYKDAGRLQEAIPLLEEAYQASKSFPELRGIHNPLIDAYTKAGENTKLANLIREQLAEAREKMPKDSPQLAGLLAQIGMSLLQQKKWSDAEPLLRECLAIRAKSQPDAFATFNMQSLLGSALLGQKKYAEAEPLLRKGYEGMKQREKSIPPQSSTRLPEVLDRLIELYTATNKPDEVKKWQTERAKYPAAAPLPEKKK